MVNLNFAYTGSINPTGASPILTQTQVWAGLQRKVRHAQEFVPIILECKVTSEEEETAETVLKIVREVKFAPGSGPKADEEQVREVCLHYAPCRVDFKQEDGTTISNIVSEGPDGELMMTYAFEWRHPGMKEGSDKGNELLEKYKKMAKMAVEGSIDTIRRLVREGEIK
ncbi:uncharacterized protein BCR38DRAFT_356571 [Pseudomassariella vexata]|uniref:DUF1857-domain-containing protein n=1 Tax=Pseudomassariella vexata TaxID=1141098 RepID=A0A1Y2D8U6_9PEZI|nr:uncharacterized protein BCR38DRAFT_356571 [Pseudomassariella vexata]ORY55679.1 hypothetical protein BCR38DRAFT_356571 [Pseudomassariella vexata]